MKRIIVLAVLLASLTFGAGYTRPPREPAQPIVYTATCPQHAAWSADAPSRWKAQMFGRAHLRAERHGYGTSILITRHN